MQKTPFKNYIWLSHNLEMFEYRSRPKKIIKLTKSSNLLRHGLRILATISEPFDIFKWGLLPIVQRTIITMKNDPRFHSHTLFPKRNATLKKNMELALAAIGFQLFCESLGKMCTQITEYPEKTVWHFFRLGILPVTPRSISLGWHDLGSLTLIHGHHEK